MVEKYVYIKSNYCRIHAERGRRRGGKGDFSTSFTLSNPEACETAETPVNRYCNIKKVPIRIKITMDAPKPGKNHFSLMFCTFLR